MLVEILDYGAEGNLVDHARRMVLGFLMGFGLCTCELFGCIMSIKARLLYFMTWGCQGS